MKENDHDIGIWFLVFGTYDYAMKILKPTAENIVKALDVLRHGGTVVHATETCYGLACDLSNPDAVAKAVQLRC